MGRSRGAVTCLLDDRQHAEKQREERREAHVHFGVHPERLHDVWSTGAAAATAGQGGRGERAAEGRAGAGGDGGGGAGVARVAGACYAYRAASAPGCARMGSHWAEHMLGHGHG
eukprot:5244443-Prymnesium_polylepis.1